jgi:diguanylate cyclase (GGDEF)-like protein
LTELALAVQQRRSLEDLLQVVVDRSSALLQADHASIRLLDPARTRLIAVCRTGEPQHPEAAEFRPGEGLIGWIAEHAETLCSNAPQTDPRFVPRPSMRPMAAFMGVPLMSGDSCVGVLSIVGRPQQRFDDEDVSLLTLVAAISGPYLEIARLSRLSQVDALTGALNRHGLDQAFPEQSTEGDIVRPLSVILVDIDHFKQVNDQHGHAAGDEVLRHVARLLSQVLRIGDAIVRYGGEEFVLVLPSVGLGRAMRIAERARTAVEAQPTSIGSRAIAVTISLGVAERAEDESRDSLVKRADAAMYEAKRLGRNRVVAAQ